ncbi:MAG: Vacuolar protease A [Bogoriella megaspora]|nr:MAG: Vacuolar protease A [Bogoriella megaspora]
MVDIHSLPKGSRPEYVVRNNGPDHLALERLKLRELAEGWPCYRDSCEWANFASIFHPGAYVYTTWSGRVSYTDFISMSQAGMDKGSFIMHRCHGTTTDVSLNATRAVTKMKATITQRFILDDCEVDAEADCRFIFFFSKNDEGTWGAQYVRHFYEKDKLLPVDPTRVPKINQEKLKQYPRSYKFLAYCQEVALGINVLKDLPGHRIDVANDTVNGQKHDLMYWHAKTWLEGGDIDF